MAAASPQTPPPGTGTLRLTRWRRLGAVAVIGGAIAWLVVSLTRSLDVVAPRVPWTTPVVLTLVLLLVAASAYLTWRRIHRDAERIDPSRAVSLLVLGKATSLAGAVIGGFCLVYGLLFLDRLEAATPRERVINGLLSALACVGLVLAGRALEWACRRPQYGEDDQR